MHRAGRPWLLNILPVHLHGDAAKFPLSITWVSRMDRTGWAVGGVGGQNGTCEYLTKGGVCMFSSLASATLSEPRTDLATAVLQFLFSPPREISPLPPSGSLLVYTLLPRAVLISTSPECKPPKVVRVREETRGDLVASTTHLRRFFGSLVPVGKFHATS